MTKRTLAAVDDDAIFLKILGRKLRHSDLTYHPFGKVEHLEEYLSREQPQWLLIDFRIPPDDGFSIIDKLSAGPLTSATNVILMSSEELPDNPVHIEQSAVCTFILKDWLATGTNLHDMCFPDQRFSRQAA